MLEFVAAVLLLVMTPGPGVLSTAGIGAAYGFRAGLGYVAGLFVGQIVVIALVISGIAAIMLSVPLLRVVLLVGSVGYLLWLAWRIASAGAKIGFARAQRPLGFWNGFALQPINPKAYAVNTTLFSGFAFLPQSLLAETALKLLILKVLWVPIHLLWLWLGVMLRRMDLSPVWQRLVNYAMAASMVLVVALALWVQWQTQG